MTEPAQPSPTTEQLQDALRRCQHALSGLPSQAALDAGAEVVEAAGISPLGFRSQLVRDVLQAVGRVTNEEIAEALATGSLPSSPPAGPSTFCGLTLDALVAWAVAHPQVMIDLHIDGTVTS